MLKRVVDDDSATGKWDIDSRQSGDDHVGSTSYSLLSVNFPGRVVELGLLRMRHQLVAIAECKVKDTTKLTKALTEASATERRRAGRYLLSAVRGYQMLNR